MNSNAAMEAVSFRITQLPDAFVARVRRTRRDDFGREVSITTALGGEPVRDGLRRVSPGERIILCGYQAVPLPSAFAEIGPIYICADPGPALSLEPGELPPGYFNRTFALRAYDEANEIVDSSLVDPARAPALIRSWLARPGVSHLHARFGGHGCFACRFDRADG